MSKRKSNFHEQATPPSWADRFLSWYCSKRFLEEIQGDLYELFEDTLSEKGPRAANWQFIVLVFRFLKPFRIKLGLWFFVSPALLVSLISILTIGIKTLRTARMNPVKALRYE